MDARAARAGGLLGQRPARNTTTDQSMNLNDEQKAMVKTWIDQGLKLSDIQNRLGDLFGLRLTYMEVRFLMDDLSIKPKDVERPAAPALAKAVPAKPAADDQDFLPEAGPEPMDAASQNPGDVTVSVDQVTRAGAVVSGKVTFSDSKTAEWYLDRMGRLGITAPEPGYQPSQADLMIFQGELQNELRKLGF